MSQSTALEDLQVWPSMTYYYRFNQGFNPVIYSGGEGMTMMRVQFNLSEVRPKSEIRWMTTRDMANVT